MELLSICQNISFLSDNVSDENMPLVTILKMNVLHVFKSLAFKSLPRFLLSSSMYHFSSRLFSDCRHKTIFDPTIRNPVHKEFSHITKY